MLGWTNFQKQNYGVHNKYECKKLSKEMIIACTKLLRCVKDNNIPFINNRVEMLTPEQIGKLCNIVYKKQ